MRTLLAWTVAAVVVTAIFGSIYLTAQSLERSGADDAPQRLASQVASIVESGRSLAAEQRETVDLGSSSQAFFVVYDSGDAPESGSARLDGSLPEAPRGVLDTARTDDANHVTWQPTPELRFATVEVRAGHSVVLAGQSLGPTERRIDSLGLLLLACWAATIALLGAGWGVIRAFPPR
jgi:hypothetical protein